MACEGFLLSFAFAQQDDVAEDFGVFGFRPALFEIGVLDDLGDGGQRHQVKGSFVPGAHQHENGMHS